MIQLRHSLVSQCQWVQKILPDEFIPAEMRGQKWKRNRGWSSIRLFASIFYKYSLCCCPHHNIKCWLKAFVKWGMGSSSSGGEGETDADAAKVAPWWSAAHCRRRALARAPRWWRWRAGAGSAAGEVDVVVDGGGDGGDSSTSLMDDLPPFDEMVKVVLSLPSYNSSNKWRILWNSAFIFCPDIWTKENQLSSQVPIRPLQQSSPNQYRKRAFWIVSGGHIKGITRAKKEGNSIEGTGGHKEGKTRNCNLPCLWLQWI